MKEKLCLSFIVLATLFLLPLAKGLALEPVPADEEKVFQQPTKEAAQKEGQTSPGEPENLNDQNKVVSEIVFIGNTLNKSSALAKKIKTKKKSDLDSRQLREDVKILYETGNFDDVEVNVESISSKDSKGKEKVRVVFSIVERSLIKRIDYKGNRKIKPSQFSDKVKSEEGLPYDQFKAGLDERAILEFYKDEGYANAQVEHYTTIDPKKKNLILTFFITEGERVTVKSLTVTGTNEFSSKKIMKLMKTRRKKVFKNEVLTEDLVKIENFYKNKGHLDAVVSTPTVHIDPERNEATIQIDLTEGPRYTVGDISFVGTSIFTEKELKKAVTMKKKELFMQKKLDESVANITGLYADKGYLRTEVTPVADRRSDTGRVNFEMSIAESAVVYVDGVYVDGNSYTKEYVFKREVLLKPGDIFSAKKLRRSVEKIYNLGFLEDVQVDAQQPRSSELADIIFSVKEGKPGVLSAGAGFSSVDRFVGTLQVQHNNLFGRAQRVDVTYEFGGRRQVFNIGWTDPWLFGYRMSGGVDLFNTVRRRDYGGISSAYREQRRGGALRLGPRLSDTLGLNFTYTLHTTEVYDVDSAIKEDLFSTFGIPSEKALITDAVKQIKSSMLTEVVVDTRDNWFDASRGSRNTASVELAGGPYGGDINYYKPLVTSSWYFPTFWKFVFSLNARASWVNAFYPSKEVPSSERFFLGGVDTVRGYDQSSILPRVYEINQYGHTEMSELPGRIYTLFNAEYKFPIVQEGNRTIFQGAFFVDAGGNWLSTRDISLTTGALDKRMKAGVGFGFRFKTPVFPIRLDFAFPLNPRQEDSKGLQPYFTIGNIF